MGHALIENQQEYTGVLISAVFRGPRMSGGIHNGF
jgi:hypothetical protein